MRIYLTETKVILENEVKADSKNFITCDAEICPEPEGGIIELLNKLRYPPNAKRNNITGDVVVKAKINELGFVISSRNC